MEKRIRKLAETALPESEFLTGVSAIIQETMGFLWTGFYFVQGDRLVLGPFTGPDACEQIERGRGVCGTAWAENRTIVVPDVEQFPGHIACSSLSKSEIVVPLHDGEGNVKGVLDIDSEKPACFDEKDAAWLERIAAILSDPTAQEVKKRSAWMSWVAIGIVLLVVLALEYFLNGIFHR